MKVQAHHATVRRAAVIGAGSMGSDIAAQIANAGVPVLLLDVVPDGADDRDVLAKGAISRQLAAGGFMHPDRAALVTPGNVEDHLDQIADTDWIVEAVFEDLAVKHALYTKVERLRRDGSIVSSNTSTIPLAQLIEGQTERFAGDFIITHFFNPPRHMQLVELVRGEHTRPEIIESAWEITEGTLGKTVILCRDTPGFIANRVGNYRMALAAIEAKRHGLTVEEADVVMGKPFGIPGTGIFGLFDYVGINLVPLVWGSFMKTLPPDDAHRLHDPTIEPFFVDMLAKGLTGRAGPGGFYRRKAPDGAKIDQVLDLATGDYRERCQPAIGEVPGNLKDLCEQGGSASDYAWSVLSRTVSYAADIADEIADSVADIDAAIRLGYNWAKGPLELADTVGCSWIVDRLEAEQRPVPARLRQAGEEGGFYAAPSAAHTVADARPAPLTVAAIKTGKSPVITNAGASVWDMGDGIAGLEIHTKMNACNQNVVDIVEQLPDAIKANFQSLVIGSDNARAFSAGADLNVYIQLVRAEDWAGLDSFVGRGQSAFLALKRAAFPVVAAVRGLALGGGAELMLHSDLVVAHAEVSLGLPERSVGIIPGWGGTVQLLLRAASVGADPVEAARRAFAPIAAATPSTSALIARDMGFLRDIDQIVMNRDFVLGVARSRAAALAVQGKSEPRPVILAGGAQVREVLHAAIAEGVVRGAFTETDKGILEVVAHVLSGGDAAAGTQLMEEDYLKLERDGIIKLAKQATTLARLEAMRDTNRPLRN